MRGQEKENVIKDVILLLPPDWLLRSYNSVFPNVTLYAVA